MKTKIIFTMLLFCGIITLVFFTFHRLTNISLPLESEKSFSEESPLFLNQQFFYKTIGNIPDEYEIRTKKKDLKKKQNFYTLEIRKFHKQNAAEAHLDGLKEKGIEAYYSPLRMGSQVLFRVRKGYFSSKKLASLQQKSLKKKYNIDAKIILLK